MNGRTLDNRFESEGILHESRWSILHAARDNELSRPVQMREVFPRALAANPEVRRYLVVTFALAQVNQEASEQIISHRIADDGTIYIISDSPRTLSLGQLLQHYQDIDLPEELGLYLISQVAHLLSEMHDLRDHQTGKPLALYHLSLNPNTILLTENGGVRVSGFALPQSDEMKTIDTVAYLAPEQIQGSQPDRRCDIFSLGLIAFELLTGKRLFPQRSISEVMAAIIRGNYDLSALKSHVDKRITALIENCLTLRREERLANAMDLAEKSDDLLQDRLISPDKTIRVFVEKFATPPKLQSYSEKERQIVRTRGFARTDLEEGTKSMTDQSPSDQQGNHKGRPGQETRISNIPYGERFKRAKRGGFGGSKTVLVLGIIAMFLFIAVVAISIKKMTQKSGKDAVSATASEMKTGKLVTIPDGVEVYAGDSLLGTTPLTFSAKQGGVLTLRHKCCPDSQVAADFEQFDKAPIRMMTVIEINSSPVGAKITLNGELLEATTPHRVTAPASDTIQIALEIPNKPVLSSGPVVLADIASFSAAGYETARLSEGGFQISGSFNERPKTQIVTFPDGASVIIAATGVEIGQTPLKYDFGDDKTLLTVSKTGYDNLQLELPPIATRKPNYRSLLFRPVEIKAEEEGSGKAVSGKITSISYEGQTKSINQSAPMTIRLPGVPCRLSLTAEGYHSIDTLVPTTLNSVAVIMRPMQKKETKVEKTEVAETTTGKGQVKIIVIDNKQTAVAGVAISAEVQLEKKKEKSNADYGKTDKEGMLKLNLDPGKYKFMANHPDYKSDDQKQEVKAGETYVVTLKIKRK
jgi:serine/threonine protein kinase